MSNHLSRFGLALHFLPQVHTLTNTKHPYTWTLLLTSLTPLTRCLLAVVSGAVGMVWLLFFFFIASKYVRAHPGVAIHRCTGGRGRYFLA